MADASDGDSDDGTDPTARDDGAGTIDRHDTVDGTERDRTSTHPFVFLAGLLLFLASAAAFLTDLATGHDVLRSLVSNGLGAVILVVWAANDTLVDPDAEVSSVPGAVGTGLLLLGVYLLVAAAVLAGTSLWHDRLGLVLWLAGTAVGLAILGFLVFPVEVLLDGSDATD